MVPQTIPRLLSILLLSTAQLFSCTDFLITAKDSTRVNGRSMEFAIPMNSQIIVHRRGEGKTSSSPSGQKGLTWTSKYGYVALNGLNVDTPVDGLNEVGLSFGALWLPETKYQDVPDAASNAALSVVDFGTWVLENFATVNEVAKALPQIYVWGVSVPALGFIPPMHFALHDAKGNSLVIEYIDGKAHVYENPNGVLTNSPTLDWQLTNLRNYINLSPINSSSIPFEDSVLAATGQGSGLLGIPGDWTPPSRFVRLSVFKEYAIKPDNAVQAINLAEHLLNTVDIPYGAVREKSGATTHIELTQWAVIKDLTNRRFYYRTYDDMTLRMIDLKAIPFTGKTDAFPFEIEGKHNVVDVTKEIKWGVFLKQK